MKKLIFVFGLMLSMVACSSNKNVETQEVMNDSIEVTDSDSTVITTLGVDSID